MHKCNEPRFYRTPITMMLLISCLTWMGCHCSSEDRYWADKDTDFLITQLKTNREYWQRRKIVYWLSQKTQEREKVIPALTHALFNDEYQAVRVAAAEWLVKIEPSAASAIPSLIKALQREDRGRQLGGWFENSDIPRYNLHEFVIELLGEMGSDAAEAIPALLEFFRSERDFWTDAGMAIRKIDPSTRDLVKEELIERRAIEALAELAKQDGDVSLIPVFIQSLNTPEDEDNVRLCAAYVLERFGTPEALDAAVPFFIQRLNHPDASTNYESPRSRAARALTRIGTPEALDAAIPALMQLLNNPDAWRRVRAAEELKDIGTPEALEAVKEFEEQ